MYIKLGISQLNIFTVHLLYWPSFVYWTFVYDTYCPCLSRINTLTLSDMVQRVSNYSIDCLVFTGLFYCENNKIGPKSCSVFGFDRFTVCSLFLKALLVGRFFMYIKLGILSLCTEPWHATRSISISWDFCLYWKAIWWIDYVYRYWLWIHIHLSTTFHLTLNCSLILKHARRSD